MSNNSLTLNTNNKIIKTINCLSALLTITLIPRLNTSYVALCLSCMPLPQLMMQNQYGLYGTIIVL